MLKETTNLNEEVNKTYIFFGIIKNMLSKIPQSYLDLNFYKNIIWYD